MKEAFNKVGAFISNLSNNIKVAMNLAVTGMSPHAVLNAANTFEKKLMDFISLVQNESTEASRQFGMNVVTINEHGVDAEKFPKSWDEYFRLVNESLEKIKPQIDAMDSRSETESWGLIAFHSGAFQTWYEKQDYLLKPLLEAFGKTVGFDKITTNLCPRERQVIVIKGKEYNLTISQNSL